MSDHAFNPNTREAENLLEISVSSGQPVLKIKQITVASGPVHENILDQDSVQPSVSLHSFRKAVLTDRRSSRYWLTLVCDVFISKIFIRFISKIKKSVYSTL